MPGNSLLLDTSVVVKHFRYPTAVVNKLAEYEELYLPQPALGELYYGAYRSGRLEKSLAQIERFLDAVDLLAADKETSVFLRSDRCGACQGWDTDSARFWCKVLKGSVSRDNRRDDGTDFGTGTFQGPSF